VHDERGVRQCTCSGGTLLAKGRQQVANNPTGTPHAPHLASLHTLLSDPRITHANPILRAVGPTHCCPLHADAMSVGQHGAETAGPREGRGSHQHSRACNKSMQLIVMESTQRVMDECATTTMCRPCDDMGVARTDNDLLLESQWECSLPLGSTGPYYPQTPTPTHTHTHPTHCTAALHRQSVA
jgi:hypothetical protein